MTDNEIIKALEQCSLPTGCKECPCFPNGPCITHKEVLSLINRQNAKIDDLERDDLPRCKDALRRANEIGMDLEKENQELKAEIEMLKKLNDEGIQYDIELMKRENTDKAEAIKEFAERVKRYIDVGHLRPPTEKCFSELDVVSMIDNLVKEMVGADNESV